MKLLELLVMGDFGRQRKLTMYGMDSEQIGLVDDFMEYYLFEYGASTSVYDDDTNSGLSIRGAVQAVIQDHTREYPIGEELFTIKEYEELTSLLDMEVHSFEVAYNKEEELIEVDIHCYS